MSICRKHYKVGMFGGCFDPLHTGHLSVISKAANDCDKLFVVISYSPNRDYIDIDTRMKWLSYYTERYGNVSIIKLKDECASKGEYDTADNWKKGADYVKAAIGEKIDAVFCGSDYKDGDNMFAKMYPESEIVYINRDEVPISSTEIRSNPYMPYYWMMLPARVKIDFVKKVLIIGNESVGKTTMTERLANHFKSFCQLESGRDVCIESGGEGLMQESDFLRALYVQANGIDEKVRLSARYDNNIIFVDTDAITTGYYAGMSKSVPQDSVLRDFKTLAKFSGKWDLVIFLESDVEYVKDGVRIDERNKPDERKKNTERLKELYRENGFEITIVNGSDYEERFQKCISLVEGIFK